ncbi:hypothetical protein PRZ48_010656 [Zasmidium cellare]|uniref:Uncharacterized protein n=1 Tax=Zasmidium cellare TaxID=395010 RepID=A0ABR0E9D6_ZASCE|nr:hypothetical protein PRZ48_010656 [Zasmidium cellare]
MNVFDLLAMFMALAVFQTGVAAQGNRSPASLETKLTRQLHIEVSNTTGLTIFNVTNTSIIFYTTPDQTFNINEPTFMLDINDDTDHLLNKTINPAKVKSIGIMPGLKNCIFLTSVEEGHDGKDGTREVRFLAAGAYDGFTWKEDADTTFYCGSNVTAPSAAANSDEGRQHTKKFEGPRRRTMRFAS